MTAITCFLVYGLCVCEFICPLPLPLYVALCLLPSVDAYKQRV